MHPPAHTYISNQIATLLNSKTDKVENKVEEHTNYYL